jgi:hypothetical protein
MLGTARCMGVGVGLCWSYMVSFPVAYRCVGFARLKTRCGALEVSWCRCCLQPRVVGRRGLSHLFFSRIVYCSLFLYQYRWYFDDGSCFANPNSTKARRAELRRVAGAGAGGSPSRKRVTRSYKCTLYVTPEDLRYPSK